MKKEQSTQNNGKLFIKKSISPTISELDEKLITEKYLREVMDGMLEGVQIFDEHLTYLYINDAAEKHNHRPKEELIGKHYAECWPGIDQTIIYDFVCQCLHKRTSFKFENEFKFPDGSLGWFLLSIQPARDGVMILSLDITEQKLINQEIARSEKLYHSLFENLLNGFAYCKMEYAEDKTADFIYLNVNKAFSHLTGLKDVIGKRVSEVIPGIQKTDPQIIAIYDRVSKTGTAETFEIYIEALKMWFFVSVYSPEIGYFVAVFDVITDRKNAEIKLREQLDELQRWYSATLDREQRSIELKKEINQLLIELGKTPRYSVENNSTE